MRHESEENDPDWETSQISAPDQILWEPMLNHHNLLAEIDLFDDCDLVHVEEDSDGVTNEERRHNHHQHDWKIVFASAPPVATSLAVNRSFVLSMTGVCWNLCFRSFEVFTSFKMKRNVLSKINDQYNLFIIWDSPNNNIDLVVEVSDGEEGNNTKNSEPGEQRTYQLWRTLKLWHGNAFLK